MCNNNNYYIEGEWREKDPRGKEKSDGCSRSHEHYTSAGGGIVQIETNDDRGGGRRKRRAPSNPCRDLRRATAASAVQSCAKTPHIT